MNAMRVLVIVVVFVVLSIGVPLHRITMQILRPGAGGVGRKSGGQPPVELVTAAGTSIDGTVHAVSAQVPRHLFWGHLRAVMVGEALARTGLRPVLDFLLRVPEVRPTAWLFVARGGKGSGVLAATMTLEPMPVQLRENQTHFAAMHIPIHPIRVSEALKEITIPGVDPTIPGISAPQARDAAWSGRGFALSGMALLHGGRVVGWLDGPAAAGYLWIKGKVRHHPLEVPCPDSWGMIALETLSQRSLITPGVQDSGLERITVQVRAKLRISEVKNCALDPLQRPGQVEQLASRSARQIEAAMRAAIEAARKARSDPFGFGERMRERSPAAWAVRQKQWTAGGLPSLPVTVHAEVDIIDTGQLFGTIPVP